MKIFKIKKLILFIFIFSGVLATAQEAHVQVHQDEKIPTLLELKTKLSRQGKLNDRYKIQLYYGELDKANKILTEYRESAFDWSSIIEYETPNYKVWVGNFRNRLEADRALISIKTLFPDAFIFKPDRS